MKKDKLKYLTDEEGRQIAFNDFIENGTPGSVAVIRVEGQNLAVILGHSIAEDFEGGLPGNKIVTLHYAGFVRNVPRRLAFNTKRESGTELIKVMGPDDKEGAVSWES